MKLAIMQPYFFPYIGYWQLLSVVDTFVIYDDVNYIKQGYVNRNSLFINGAKTFYTLELSGASSFKLINEIQVGRNIPKLIKTLEQNYKKAPYFMDVFPMISNIINYQENNLSKYLGNSIFKISVWLDLKPKFIYSSDIEKNNTLKGKDKVLAICKILQATKYLNAIGGQELYSKDEFMTNGIKLYFIKTLDICYPQFNQSFVPNLSIVDVLMHCGKEKTKYLLTKYELQ